MQPNRKESLYGSKELRQLPYQHQLRGKQQLREIQQLQLQLLQQEEEEMLRQQQLQMLQREPEDQQHQQYDQNGLVAVGLVPEDFSMAPLPSSTHTNNTSSPGAYLSGGGRPEDCRLQSPPASILLSSYHSQKRICDTRSSGPSSSIASAQFPSEDTIIEELIEARQVTGEGEAHYPIAVLDEAAAESEAAKSHREQKLCIMFFLVGALVTTCIFVAWHAIVTIGNDVGTNNATNSTTYTYTGTINGTAVPEIYLQNILLDGLEESFPGNHLQKDLTVANSPQSKAFQWLSKDPNLYQYSRGRVEQRFALASLYYSTNGSLWLNDERWLSYDHHECEWYMSSFQTILTYLHPETNPCQRLGGPEWQSFHPTNDDDSWTYRLLWLGDNNLVGTLPDEIYWLTNLESIHLSRNSLIGTLFPSTPTILAKSWSNLQRVSVYYNQISGTLPSELALLVNLTMFVVGVAGNMFRGTVPTELGLMTQLTVLSLSNNPLDGTIPSELGDLKQLISLDIKGTNMTGTLPTELGRLTSLAYSYLSESHFSGTVPTELGNLVNLRWFLLENSELTGNLPSEIGRMESLGELRLANNSFSSSIPMELWHMNRVYFLDLSDNPLIGTIPEAALGEMSDLIELSLERTMMSGSLPSTIGLLSNLELLRLSMNSFSGSLPSELANIGRNMLQNHISKDQALEVLLNDNAFVGSIPSDIGTMNHAGIVGVWNIANNNFSGTLPNEMGRWSNLTYFNVSGNALLTGTIPVELCGYSQLDLQFDCSNGLCGCNCTCSSGLRRRTSFYEFASGGK